MRLCAAALLTLACLLFSSPDAGAWQLEGDQGKLSLSGYGEARGIAAFDQDTPDEDPSAELGLELKGSTGSWLATKVSMRAVHDGKVIDPQNSSPFTGFDRVYQDRNPYVNVDEAYVDLYTGKADFRLGIQKFAWGRLDEMNPTDNLNTEDLTEGGTNDEVDRKIGVPAVKVNLYSDLCNVELGWVPRFVPYRLPTSEERWFPGVLQPPELLDTGTTVGTIPVATSYKDIDLPAATMGNSEAGIRVSKYIGGWDLSVSYFTGYDPMPLTEAAADLTVRMNDPLALDYDLSTALTLEPGIHRMHVYGLDATTTVGSFTVRGEYAYFHNKYFNRTLDSVLKEMVSQERQNQILSDFLDAYFDSDGQKTVQVFPLDPQVGLQMDSMKYGLGLDYIYGDSSVSVQCIQEFIPDYDEDRPVYFSKNGLDTLLTFLFKQFFLQNTMELNLRAAYGVEFQDFLIKPSLKYSFTNNLQATIGVIVIGGKDDDSLFGQFRDNDEAFARVRCSF